MYFRVHDNILIDKWHLFPVILQELLQHRGGPSRTTELDSLCRIHQLDRQDMIQVVHDLKQFRRRIRPHTHMILLSITRHDRIAARRMKPEFRPGLATKNSGNPRKPMIN